MVAKQKVFDYASKMFARSSCLVTKYKTSKSIY